MKSYQEKLVEGAISGNKEDVEKLLQSCMQDILHMALLHSNRQEAEDIVQEVAIVLYRKIKTLSDPQSFKKWLSVVVRNVSVSHMRKVYKIRENVDYEEDMELVEPVMDNIEFIPEKYVENAELRSIIIEEINSLSKMQEICLSYYYLEEFKRSDIVEVTGFTPKQVSGALDNGKKTLKKLLEQRFGKNFAYAAAPVGSVLALARVFEARRDEMVSPEWCEQMYETVLSRLNGAAVVPEGRSLSVNIVACTVVTVAVAGIAFYMLYPGRDEPIETAPPPVIEIQQELEEPEELEAEREIRTVADMIGEDEAELLTGFVDNGTNWEEWDSFVEHIGAASVDQATSVLYNYTLYLLEKQNKRLLLARQEAPTGESRILYLFGDREEPKERIARIILLFNE